jgi:hypothetical protein
MRGGDGRPIRRPEARGSGGGRPWRTPMRWCSDFGVAERRGLIRGAVSIGARLGQRGTAVRGGILWWWLTAHGLGRWSGHGRSWGGVDGAGGQPVKLDGGRCPVAGEK